MKYNYPVTPQTINNFVSDIVKSVKNKSSITFAFSENCRGGTAWSRFVLDAKAATSLYKDLDNYKICYIDATEILESSKVSFFLAILQALNPELKLNSDDLSLTEIVSDCKKEIAEILKTHQGIVFFLTKLQAYKNFNYEYGNILSNIWVDYKGKLNFVILLTIENYKSYIEENLGSFDEVAKENIVEIKSLSDADIEYSIKHWEEILEVDFGEPLIDLIKKRSNGNVYASKMLSQSAARNIDHKDDLVFHDEHFKKILTAHFNTPASIAQNLKIEDLMILLADKDITMHFSFTESKILTELITAKNVLSRESIADILWGKLKYDKYSDWAIDKNISVIRKKLQELGFTGQLKAIRNQGFTLIQT